MRYIVGLLSLMLTCVALSTLAVAVTSIEGSWIGSGTVSHRSNVDRVQCRVRYTKSSEKTYATSSVCTTENGRYEVSGHVTNIGGNRYQGVGERNGQSHNGPSRRPAVGDRNQS